MSTLLGSGCARGDVASDPTIKPPGNELAEITRDGSGI
jgi:hypothetical protein